MNELDEKIESNHGDIQTSKANREEADQNKTQSDALSRKLASVTAELTTAQAKLEDATRK